MDRGRIVLACPGSGGTRDRLIANLLLFDVLHAAKGRADTPPDRRPFWVFLDEVQTYDGAASGNLAGLLEQSAKYGVRAFLLNQNPERLTPQTLNAVTTNRSHLLSTALNARAAGLIAKEWGGHPDPAALPRLPRYRFLAQVTQDGELSKPFALGGVTVEQLFGPGHPERVLSVGHRKPTRMPPRWGHGEYRFSRIEVTASVPGPRAFARRWGHLLMWAPTVAPLRRACERKSPPIAAHRRHLGN